MESDYVSTDPVLLFIIIIILIIILTYLFNNYVNPFSKNHSKYQNIVDKHIFNIFPTTRHLRKR